MAKCRERTKVLKGLILFPSGSVGAWFYPSYVLLSSPYAVSLFRLLHIKRVFERYYKEQDFQKYIIFIPLLLTHISAHKYLIDNVPQF